MDTIAHNLAAIHEQIARSCATVGRDPAGVRLVAVSKTKPAQAVREALAAGQRLFGENRVQEARDKIPLVDGPAEWHLIGPLQKNKVKSAVSLFHMIHSVDSVALAQEVSKRRNGPPMPVLLQVNVGGEAQKFGFEPRELAAALREMAPLPNIAIRGLMTVPPAVADPEEARPWFRQLAALARGMAALDLPGVEMTELSMGMSHDYRVAVEEGATLVRVGSAIFGARG